MNTSSKQAALFGSALAAIALLSTVPPVSAAGFPQHDFHEFSPSPEDDRATITIKADIAGKYAAAAQEQRRQDAAGARPGDAQCPARATREDDAGAASQGPSSGGADKTGGSPSSEPAGAARSPYYGPGLRYRTGPKAYLLPLDRSSVFDY